MSDPIDRAAEVLTETWEDRVKQGISDAPRGHCHAFADALADAGLLVTPAHDAAVAAKAWDEGYTKACHDHGGYETCGQRGSHGRSNANPYLTKGADDV